MICAATTEQSCAGKAARVGPHARFHGCALGPRWPACASRLGGLARRLAWPAQGLRWAPLAAGALDCRRALARRGWGQGPWPPESGTRGKNHASFHSIHTMYQGSHSASSASLRSMKEILQLTTSSNVRNTHDYTVLSQNLARRRRSAESAPHTSSPGHPEWAPGTHPGTPVRCRRRTGRLQSRH